MIAEHYYIILDLETGGLNPKQNPITSCAFIVLDNNLQEVERYENLVKPYNNLELTQEALDLTGLSEVELIEKGITIEQLYKDLKTTFKKYKTNKYYYPILVGHKLSKFDVGGGLDNLEDEKQGGYLSYMFNSFKDNIFNYVENFMFDTLYYSRMFFFNKDLPNFQLGTICEMLGIVVTDAHGAMNDVEANTELFKVILKGLREGGITVSQNSQVREKSRTKFKF